MNLTYWQKDCLSNLGQISKNAHRDSLILRVMQNLIHLRHNHYPNYERYAIILEKFINLEISVIETIEQIYVAVDVIKTAVRSASALTFLGQSLEDLDALRSFLISLEATKAKMLSEMHL